MVHGGGEKREVERKEKSGFGGRMMRGEKRLPVFGMFVTSQLLFYTCLHVFVYMLINVY